MDQTRGVAGSRETSANDRAGSVMGLGGVACPKGRTRKQIKGRKDRAEAAVKKLVRAQVAYRDGHCRLMGCGPCHGESEWAHLGDKKRARTRGQAPTVRHTTEG